MLGLRAPAAAGALRIAAAGAVLAAVGAPEASEEEERGDLGRIGPLPFAGALRKGELVRPTIGGVPVRDGG